MIAQNIIENLKNEGRFQARLQDEIGVVKDFDRTEVVVHIGKPIGAISGWVGPVFWQVWVEPGAKPGQIVARIANGNRLEWEFNAASTKETLLNAAKEKALKEAEDYRQTKLRIAKANLQQLENVSN